MTDFVRSANRDGVFVVVGRQCEVLAEDVVSVPDADHATCSTDACTVAEHLRQLAENVPPD